MAKGSLLIVLSRSPSTLFTVSLGLSVSFSENIEPVSLHPLMINMTVVVGTRNGSCFMYVQNSTQLQYVSDCMLFTFIFLIAIQVKVLHVHAYQLIVEE